MSMERNKRVKVLLRTRPTPDFASDIIQFHPDGKSVQVNVAKQQKKATINNQIQSWAFRLDGIMHNESQEAVFGNVASDIVSSALDGYNGTILCYGQTGAGKTFTMSGATENYKHRGIIPRAISHLFKEIEAKHDCAVTVRLSYLEIYNESLFDLLGTLPEAMAFTPTRDLSVVEDDKGVYVKGLSCHLAQNEKEALNYLFEGETNRVIASHSLNKHSSRSHCIFTVHIESRSRVQTSASYVSSRLNFVDLAGSERIGKTGSIGKTAEEALYINKSLTFLEQIVIALADRKRDHVPFRQSKLTHYLKNSIGGTSNTVLVANVWGETQHIEETISTLRFATRMMCVAAEPVLNQQLDPVLLNKRYEEEIQQLKQELAMHDTLTNKTNVVYDPLSEQQKFDIRQQVRAYVNGDLDEIDIVNVRQIKASFEVFKSLTLSMQQDVENDIRSRFNLSEKAQSQVGGIADKVGIRGDDSNETVGVGELDRSSGFGVGQAPKSLKPDQSGAVVNTRRKAKKLKERGGSPTMPPKRTISPTSQGKSVAQDSGGSIIGDDKPMDGRSSATEANSVEKGVEQVKPTSFPPREVAFEEFKKERGSEINRILTENKVILAEKKQSYGELAHDINSTKADIDTCRAQLEVKQIERESEGGIVNEDGEEVITEEEFNIIQSMKQHKQSYRAKFEKLRQLKTEVQYCQRLVEQCRARLIQEFDNWFNDSFLNDPNPVTSLDEGYGARAGTRLPKGLPEDESKKYNRLREQLDMENPEAATFYNARMQTKRRNFFTNGDINGRYDDRHVPMAGSPVRIIRDSPGNQVQTN